MAALVSILSLLAGCTGGGDAAAPAAPQTDPPEAQAPAVEPESARADARFDTWAQRLMTDAISPVIALPGDLTEAWVGADLRPANVVVRVPRTLGKPTVSISPPENGRDAASLVRDALNQLRQSGGGTLRVAPGEYRFLSADPRQPELGHLLLDQLTDVDIQGAGATFMFERDLDGIHVQDSQRVRIQGAKLRQTRVSSGFGRMRSVNGQMQLQLDHPLPAGGTVRWVQHINEDNRTWPQVQTRGIITPSMPTAVQIDARTFTSPEFRALKDGQRVAVKFSYYGARAVYIRDSNKGINEDIVLDGIAIGSNGGMGVVAKTRGRGIAIQNTSIAADADKPFSTNYDGIHVVAAAGDILIRGNTIANTGDDQMNLRSIIHKVEALSSDSVTLANDARLIRVGDEVAFFDGEGGYVGRRSIASAPPIGDSDTVRFGLAAGEPMPNAAYARVLNFTPRRLAIVNNSLSDGVARGILVQISNGLIQNNAVRGIPRNAIRLLTSFEPWLEGSGAFNVRIVGNAIEGGGREPGVSYETGIITALGEIVTARLANTALNGWIRIEGNRFTAPGAACVVAHNTRNLTQENNICSGR